METVADIMRLIKKYNVESAWSPCINFLKQGFVINDIFRILSLAVAYELGDLREFCIGKIQQHPAEVRSMIDLGTMQLRLNENQRVSSVASESISQLVHDNLQQFIPNAAENENESDIIELQLTKPRQQSFEKVDQTHSFTFTSNSKLWLKSLHLSKVYDENLDLYDCNVSLWIIEENHENNTKSIVARVAKHFKGSNRVELLKPIEIRSNHFVYRVFADLPVNPKSLSTIPTIKTHFFIKLAENIYISFEKENKKGVVVASLNFKADELTNN